MKTTKIYFRPQLVLNYFCLSLITGCFFSCDVLEPDGDVLKPDVRVSEEQVYVYSGNSTFIDLASKIQTNLPVRFSVTTQPRLGTLTDLGKGMLQYAPGIGNAGSRDAFEFTVFSLKDEIVLVDTVAIAIEKDSADLPCGIFPGDDHVYGVQKSIPVVIPVLSNDYVCSADSADLEVSIFRPANDFPPYYGTVEVMGQSVIYTAGSQFDSGDKFIYKVHSRKQPHAVAFGIVYLHAEDTCGIVIRDDVFTLTFDSLSRFFALPVLDNDSLCRPLENHVWSVVQPPLYGEVKASISGFTYQLNSLVVVTPSFSDHFLYEVCDGNNCETARVDLKAKIKVDSCEFAALPDAIDVSDYDTLLVAIDVLGNDELCGGYSSFEITQAPHHGTAFIYQPQNAIAYERDPAQNKNDSLEYRICKAQLCSRAKVYIKREK